MFRYRSNNLRYKNVRQPVCPFCVPTADAELIAAGETSRILRTPFPYDVWEFRDVEEHLMLAPRRHVRSLAELDEAERAEIMGFMAEYEAKGYNIYARAAFSVARSIPQHQHTHLIKIARDRPRVMVYMRRPYWLFKK
jgi:diadenosine tetraphosphate (Ap4A) HIT family hydrolase